MYLTQLAKVLRAAGLDVEEVDGWKTRGHGGMHDEIRTLTFHHTAGPRGGDMPSLGVLTNGRKGLRGPLAQLGVGRSGRVYVVAAGLCWHAGASRHIDYTNGYAVGVEAENTGTGQDWPDAQIAALATLFAALCIEFKLSPDDVLGHRETCNPPGRKIDPFGVSLDAFRARVARRIDVLRERASRDDDRKPVAPKFTLDRELHYDPREKVMRGDDVKAVQRRLMSLGYKLPEFGADGWYGEESRDAVEAFQKARRLIRDGVVGPVTTKALGGKWTG
jgi:hypothetical protein